MRMAHNFPKDKIVPQAMVSVLLATNTFMNTVYVKHM